jgi:ribosomal protein S18 acetylase RimI-like enzyme
MKIVIKKTLWKEVEKFNKKEWREMDIKNYGKPVHWNHKDFILKATEDGKTVGLIKAEHDGGVIFIETLIIEKEKRGLGIGKKLITEIEKQGKKIGVHKIYLYTGKKWGANNFYKKMGYKLTDQLPNHYFKVNFVVYSKFI